MSVLFLVICPYPYPLFSHTLFKGVVQHGLAARLLGGKVTIYCKIRNQVLVAELAGGVVRVLLISARTCACALEGPYYSSQVALCV